MTGTVVSWAHRAVPAPGTRVAIAGGAGGIGRALVAACCELDLRVAVLDLPAALAAHPSNAELSLAMDASDPKQVRAAFTTLNEKFDALDVLLFLVGFTLTPPRPTADIAAADWDEVLRVNLTGAHLVTSAALPMLKRGRAASIVMISSGLGVSVLQGYGPYAAAKAGVIALTKTLAVEHAPAVRANALAPSAILTDFMKGGGRNGRSDGTWFDPTPYLPSIPLRRLADVDDVIGPMLFLASPAAGFMTGQTLHVNGGRYMP
jgi:3-oxoacyl-[acyl-carrier protein] reductase